MHSLDLAIQQYINEYGRAPIPATSFDTASPEGIALLTILLGKEPPDQAASNPRMLVFLNTTDAKGRKAGLTYDSKGGVTGFFDEWGHPYLVRFPASLDGPISLPDGSMVFNRRAAILSSGRDGKFGTADDIVPGREPPKPGFFDRFH